MTDILLQRVSGSSDFGVGSVYEVADAAWSHGADPQEIGDAYGEGEFVLVPGGDYTEHTVILQSTVTTNTYEWGDALENVTPPSIAGTPTHADTLTVTPGVWRGTDTVNLSYQWRTNTLADLTGVDTALGGATSTTYVLQVADEGLYVYCVETAMDDVTTAAMETNVLGPIT